MNKDNISRIQRFLLRYLWALTNKHQIAKELTQETFYQAIKSINDMKTTSNLEEEYFRKEDKISFCKRAHQLSNKRREIFYLWLLGYEPFFCRKHHDLNKEKERIDY